MPHFIKFLPSSWLASSPDFQINLTKPQKKTNIAAPASTGTTKEIKSRIPPTIWAKVLESVVMML